MRVDEPWTIFQAKVEAEWIDYNGHMNDAAYATVFSRAVDVLMDRIHLDAAERRATKRTLFTLQTMLHYFREASLGQALSVSCHLLEHDEKRMRVWLEMRRRDDGERLAASEQLLLSIDQGQTPTRAAPWPAETRAALEALQKAQAGRAHPTEAGAGIALKRKS